MATRKKKPKKRSTPGTAKKRRKPGRRKGSRVGGSKSERIRELLGSGMTAPEIAKKVGCSVPLVYVVKSQARGSTKRGPGTPRKTVEGPNGLVASIEELQRERDRMREVLVRIRDLLDRLE